MLPLIKSDLGCVNVQHASPGPDNILFISVNFVFDKNIATETVYMFDREAVYVKTLCHEIRGKNGVALSEARSKKNVLQQSLATTERYDQEETATQKLKTIMTQFAQSDQHATERLELNDQGKRDFNRISAALKLPYELN